MIRPSALTRVTNSSPTETDEVDDARERALGDHDVVERPGASAATAPRRSVRGMQHHPLVELRRAVEHRFQRVVQFGKRDLGEEAEAAEVHAEDRDVAPGWRDASGHAEQRAVAAEHDDQVARPAAGRRANCVGPAGRRPASAAVSVSKTGCDAARLEPSPPVSASMSGGLVELRLGDDADAGDRACSTGYRRAAAGAAGTRRLPSLPVIGDGGQPAPLQS